MFNVFRPFSVFAVFRAALGTQEGGEAPADTDNLLLESGDALLLESGSQILLESA